MSAAMTTTFSARPGGVTTTEVGTITGELELESTLSGGRCRHRIRYAGADEWYRIEGEEPVETTGPEDLARLHEALVGSLRGVEGEARESADPPHGSQEGRDADDPAAGSFGGARRG